MIVIFPLGMPSRVILVVLGPIPYENENKKIHCVSITNSNFRAHFKEGGVRWEKQQLTTMITRAELTGLSSAQD